MIELKSGPKLEAAYKEKYGRDLKGKNMGQFHNDFDTINGHKEIPISIAFHHLIIQYVHNVLCYVMEIIILQKLNIDHLDLVIMLIFAIVVQVYFIKIILAKFVNSLDQMINVHLLQIMNQLLENTMFVKLVQVLINYVLLALISGHTLEEHEGEYLCDCYLGITKVTIVIHASFDLTESS